MCPHSSLKKMIEKKKQNLKYKHLPAKKLESVPQDGLLVYIIGPYKIRREGHEDPLILKSLTRVYPENVWF